MSSLSRHLFWAVLQRVGYTTNRVTAASCPMILRCVSHAEWRGLRIPLGAQYGVSVTDCVVDIRAAFVRKVYTILRKLY